MAESAESEDLLLEEVLNGKKSRNRSPNHPFLDLEDALKRAELLHKEYGRHQVPVGNAHELWGYKQHSGLANQCLAALKAYGLVAVEGKAKERRLELTDRAERIIRNAPDRVALLKKAAKEPTIHAELLEEYSEKGLPPDDILRSYLLWEREGGRFNDDVVDDFIERFRSTLGFSGLDIGGEFDGGRKVDTPKNETDPKGSSQEIKVGSHVQWTSDGQERFPVPKSIAAISEDGEWAFVEDSPTGIPMSELSVVASPESAQPQVTPPPNPFYKPQSFAGLPLEGPEVRFPLEGGANEVIIRLKKPVSKKDFERITQLLKLSEDSLVESQEQPPTAPPHP